MNKELLIINDISRLNPILVDKIIAPTTTEEIREIILSNQGPISIGGARCSMGGQTALENSFHIDMRQFNKVIEFNKKAQTITVQTGITWHEIQKYIDPHNLAIKIMQTYANFTVGGTLSVNSHGRYMGLGPVILSTKQIKVILADGSIIEADRTNNPDIFFGIIGGYGGLGVIIEVTLELVDNSKIERISKKLSIEDYPQYFAENIKNSTKVIFHNADLYPSEYKKVMAISWIITDKDLTSQDRLRKIKKIYLFEKYFLWAISETPLGKYRREYLYDPIILNSKKIVWRNNEASYNFLELEPLSRKKSTYVLQEYFIPIDNINEFIPKMAKILQRYEVNVINISIRHAIKDPGTLLAWAEDEVFAFVLYYKQYTNEVAKNKVAIWTREIIESALECNGSYYLPYQPHATPEQFHRAYPRANDYFALKKKLDPDTKFLNKLWEQYYLVGAQAITNNKSESDFKNIFLDTYWRDKFYLFLQNVYNIYPEDKFHYLILQASKKFNSDQEIYKYIQEKLPSIKPFLSELRYAVPALKKQKIDMLNQTLKLLDNQIDIDGYVEIGTTGRYIGNLQKHINISGDIYLINDQEPSYSPVDIVERGGLKKIGNFLKLNNYNPIDNRINDNSVDLVTCYIGLHHSPLDKLDNFVRSIFRILRPGGNFILRDHNVDSSKMHSLAALAHAVFNAGLNISWEANDQELRHFTSTNHLSKYLESMGFKDSGERIYQPYDPSQNCLMKFSKMV